MNFSVLIIKNAIEIDKKIIKKIFENFKVESLNYWCNLNNTIGNL